MRVVINWFRGNEDGYIEVYKVDDEEFRRALEKLSPDNDPDRWRELVYSIFREGEGKATIQDRISIHYNSNNL